MYKPALTTNEVFKGKLVDPVIGEHPIFKDPEKALKVSKIFPSIGLSNFKEEANIDKCLIDIKKDGSYVLNLLRSMSDQAVNAKDQIFRKAEQMRFLETNIEKRIAFASKMQDIYRLTNSLNAFSYVCDPSVQDVKDQAICSTSGKIELRLYKDIIDPQNNDTQKNVLFKKGMFLAKIYTRLRDQAVEFMDMPAIDSLPEKKVFDRENMPNKKYQIVFASDGKEGLWDIATMSMRGIRSCQSWNSDYPRCIIGSILSRFVGIIYLTSGVPAEPHEGCEKLGSLGTKMIKRCVVRYIFDREANDGQGAPCLLLDRIYPDKDNPDRDVLTLFIDKLVEKTKLKVYYGPDLKDKLKHIYLPTDNIHTHITNRERPYQDTPLRSKQEFDIQLLIQNQLEAQRYSNLFTNHLSVFIASKMEDDYKRRSFLPPELKKIINGVKLNTSFTGFSQSIILDVMSLYRQPDSSSYYDSRNYYRAYLMKFFSNLKKLKETSAGMILTASQEVIHGIDQKSANVFIDYLFTQISTFTKTQIVRPFFNQN